MATTNTIITNVASTTVCMIIIITIITTTNVTTTITSIIARSQGVGGTSGETSVRGESGVLQRASGSAR